MLRKKIKLSVIWAVVLVQCLMVPALALADAEPEGQSGEYVLPDRSPAGGAADRKIAREDSGGGGEDDEYNFSWLDPDKKVFVLQNRKYRKKGRAAIYLSGALDLSNPYRSSYGAIPRASYWFSEQWGIEAFAGFMANYKNENLEALERSSSALPFVREIRSYYGGAIAWNPWYAKLNFFNKILYFDWMFLLGLGQVSTAIDQNRVAGGTPNFKTENLFALYTGTALNFYLSKNWLVRLDLIGIMYSATGADNVTKTNKFNWEFATGIGYAF